MNALDILADISVPNSKRTSAEQCPQVACFDHQWSVRDFDFVDQEFCGFMNIDEHS